MRAPLTAALLFALSGAALSAAELAFEAHRQPIYRNFHYHRLAGEGLRRFAFAHSTIHVQDLGCGPLDVFVQVRSGYPALSLDLRFAASGRQLERVRAQEPAQWVHVRVPDTDGAPGTESLDLHSEVPPNPWGFAAIVDDVRVRPWAPCRAEGQVARLVVRRAVDGLAIGLLLWALVWPAAWHRWLFGVVARADVRRFRTVERPASTAGAQKRGWNPRSLLRAHRARVCAVLVTWAALFVLFGLWAVIRPPLQSPDEVDHFARILSMARQPWLVSGEEVRLPATLLTPFALRGNEPLEARKLMFDGEAQLTSVDVAGLKRAALDFTPADDDHVLSHAWAYPPAYYLPVFVVGRTLTGWLSLSPYDAFYTYRLASAALSAALWVLVAAALVRVFTARGDALLALLVMVSTPMVAFLAGSLNADAAMLPLAVLTTLLVWDLARTGRGLLPTFVSLLALALSKPAAMVVILSLTGALIVTAVVRRALSAPLRDRPSHHLLTRLRTRLLYRWPELPAARDATVACVRAMVLAYAGYYAWASPHLIGTPLDLSLTAYLDALPLRACRAWAGFWGQPGWMDYRLPWGWYGALAALSVLNAIYYVARPSRRYGSFAWFAILSAAALGAGLLVGEYLTVPRVGFTLQGRYFLPALPAFAVLLMHRGHALRFGFVALVIVCNLLLLDTTARRYYTDAWRGVLTALPYYR